MTHKTIEVFIPIPSPVDQSKLAHASRTAKETMKFHASKRDRTLVGPITSGRYDLLDVPESGVTYVKFSSDTVPSEDSENHPNE